MSQPAIREGGRIWWPSMKLRGYVLSISGQVAKVILDNDDEHNVSIASGAIEPDPFSIGARVVNSNGVRGIISGAAPSERLPTWRVDWADGQTSSAVEMSLRPAELLDPVERMEAEEISSAHEFNLRSVAADMWARNRSEELVSLAHARVDLKPHQVSVAHRVVSEVPHRFLLCDEVGLGKTIEAAMVLKELRARSDARRVLILVPPGLQRQWQFELKTKFGEVFSIFNRNTISALLFDTNVHNPWADNHSVITSHSFAAYSDERIAEIASVPWDLVIVDEAHHARRQRQGTSFRMTRLYRLVRALTTPPEFSQRSVLFLTATPMQLQTHELFSLVEMLHHTLFASEDDFDRHLSSRSGVSRLAEGLDAALPAKPAELIRLLPDGWIEQAARLLGCDPDDVREQLTEPSALLDEIRSQHRLSEVMLRNRRAVVGGFMPRHARHWELELPAREAEIQEEMEQIIHEGFIVATQQRRNAVGFLMTTWQKMLASSSRALRRSLERRCARLATAETVERLSQEMLDEYLDEESEDDVEGYVREAISGEIERLEAVISRLKEIAIDAKAATLISNLREIFEEDPRGKVLIFTQFRDTQSMLNELIVEQGWTAHLFNGGLNVAEKDRAVENFRDGTGPQVLICTEAGGEGRNLQFAHLLVNYDLPWNPMRVEQRIGRVDRVGQEHPVLVFNFHVRGSIESRILEVLDQRINLFENSIGGLEPILGDAEDDIRAAMRLAAADRDRALREVGARVQRRVDEARRAESQMEDFVLDGRSSYSAGLIELVHQREASTVAQEDFERMLTALLGSVRTYIGPKSDSGERQIQFHPPFTEEHRDLLDGDERRRVCFDPRVSVDSAQVEYFGFGHSIVDQLVARATRQVVDGTAAVRVISPVSVPSVRPGWQFNWLLTAGGSRPSESVVSIFVDDDGVCDLDLGAALLLRSRALHGPEQPSNPQFTPQMGSLQEAYTASERVIADRRDSLYEERRMQSLDRRDTDVGRIGRFYRNRAEAAQHRLNGDRRTLERLQASSDENERRVIPIWEENVRRSEASLAEVERSKQRELQDLNRSLSPDVNYSLLCLARIVAAPE